MLEWCICKHSRFISRALKPPQSRVLCSSLLANIALLGIPFLNYYQQRALNIALLFGLLEYGAYVLVRGIIEDEKARQD